jgi:hypothetical protein
MVDIQDTAERAHYPGLDRIEDAREGHVLEALENAVVQYETAIRLASSRVSRCAAARLPGSSSK